MSVERWTDGPWGTVWRQTRLATKPLLMPALAVRFVRTEPTRGFRRVVTGQALCWVGDMALMGRGRRTFLAGLGSFLGAHVAYVSAYRSRSSRPLLATSGRRGLLAAGSLATAAMALAARRQDPGLTGPVLAYGVTLTTMVVAASAIDPERGRRQVLLGASLFLVSDTLIGVHKFLVPERSPVLEAAVMATYTAGQWCISEGMAAS
jgi:uncharacterized membrane protein YhhN